MATGASAWGIFRQLLTESMVVAFAGGIVGLAIAALGSKLLIAFAARMTPLSGEIHLDFRVLLFVAVLCVFAGVLFGALPGFVASRDRLSVRRDAGAPGPCSVASDSLLCAVDVCGIDASEPAQTAVG
jgi:hypothetical protein